MSKAKKTFEKLAEYFKVTKVTAETVTLTVTLHRGEINSIVPRFINVEGAELAPEITVVRGAKHIAYLTVGGENEQFAWGYEGSDKLSDRFTYIRRALVEAIKNAGINIEVATDLAPIEVRVKEDISTNEAEVIADYPDSVEEQHIPIRFTDIDAAYEFKAKLEANENVSSEKPDGYLTQEQREANKREFAKNKANEEAKSYMKAQHEQDTTDEEYDPEEAEVAKEATKAKTHTKTESEKAALDAEAAELLKKYSLKGLFSK